MKTPLKLSYVTGLIVFFIAVFYAFAQELESTESDTSYQEAYSSEEPTSAGPPPRGKSGYISVFTTPSKARVYVDGDDLGITPIDKKSFRSGRFDLTIMMQGRDLVNERINIWPDKITKIDRDLKMPFGTLILRTKPSRTKVIMDEEEIGRTKGGPLTINNVTSGTHILVLKARGYRSKTVEIEVMPEDTTRLEVKLTR